MNNEYTEEEKKLADEIRKDINEGKKSIEINAKRSRLNRLYAKRREEAYVRADVALCNGGSFSV
jgi:hypothetical protein